MAAFPQYDRANGYPFTDPLIPPSSILFDTAPSLPLPPSPDSYKPPPPSRRKPPNHVPRPPNAFMLFRSAFWAAQRVTRTVEHDHRHISRIAGHCWKALPTEEKARWNALAEAQKAEHAQRYPGYKFVPTVRERRPVRRKVRRNGEKDLQRCEDVAKLLLAGKQGYELESAVKEMDVSSVEKPNGPLYGWKPASGETEEIVPFLDPLLPPAERLASPVPTSTPEQVLITPRPYFSSYGREDANELAGTYPLPIPSSLEPTNLFICPPSNPPIDIINLDNVLSASSTSTLDYEFDFDFMYNSVSQPFSQPQLIHNVPDGLITGELYGIQAGYGMGTSAVFDTTGIYSAPHFGLPHGESYSLLQWGTV